MSIVSHFCMSLLVAVLALGAAAPVPKPKPPTLKEIEAKVYGSWYEYDGIYSGRPMSDGFEAVGWKFGREDAAIWQFGGELSAGEFPGGVKIDITKTPWRLDVHERKRDNTVVVIPGIFKLDGDDLIWATEPSGDWWWQLRPSGEYAGRPKDFTSTPENQYEVRRLKRCEYLQTKFVDPPREKKR